MHPVHDVDALLLLAITLASKRRPAELVEIVAAAELIAGAIPSEPKLAEAFHRLSTHGLIGEAAGSFTLTPEAQQIMAALPKRKLEPDERVFGVKEKLVAYKQKGEYAPIVLTIEQLGAAILAHRTAVKGPGKNLLVPKPKPAESDKPGQRQRKPLAARRRKA